MWALPSTPVVATVGFAAFASTSSGACPELTTLILILYEFRDDYCTSFAATLRPLHTLVALCWHPLRQRANYILVSSPHLRIRAFLPAV
jgi:hypothetical protein